MRECPKKLWVEVLVLLGFSILHIRPADRSQSKSQSKSKSKPKPKTNEVVSKNLGGMPPKIFDTPSFGFGFGFDFDFDFNFDTSTLRF